MKVFNMKDADFNSGLKINIDGIEYEIRVTDESNFGSYANVVVVDNSTGESYYCNGMLELNKHRFTFRYNKEYNFNRDNYICGGDLIIEVL